MGYYVRFSEDEVQEERQYSEEIIREIVIDDINLLGGKEGNRLKTDIKNYLEENNLNVKDSIDDVMDAIEGKVTIRGKLGGVCIRTEGLPCAHDKRTNALLCAYNMCPNLYHTFYMLPVTINEFREKVKLYKTLEAKGMTRNSEKEKNNLGFMASGKLKDELEELKKEIDKHGADDICEKYPELIEIVKNYDAIVAEVEAWE